ncbi:MAG: sulfatase [Candidatus Hydrogenedentota bacterium]
MRVMLLVLVLSFLLTSCGKSPEPEERPNVALIVIDALRYDRVDAERNGKPVMPTLKAFRDESLWFSNAAVACTWTKPSMVSMFTSLYVPAHGVVFSSTAKNASPTERFVAEELTLLPEMLQEAGYFTMGVQTNPHLTHEMGFAQGMDAYPYLALARADRVTQKALALLDEHGGENPFFLYVHYIDPHEPYWPPDEYKRLFAAEEGIDPADLAQLAPDAFKKYREDAGLHKVGWKKEREFGPLAPEQKEVIRAYYDGEARFADDQAARLLEALERDFPNTLIIITADHGEELWDHGATGHGHSLYEELAHVPLAMKGPGIESGIVEEPAEAIDLVPTIAGFVKMPSSELWQGRDLLGGDSRRDARVFSRTRASIPFESVDLLAVREGGWKLIVDQHTDEDALFNLAKDPGETRNVLGERPKAATALRNALTAHRRQCQTVHERLAIPDDTAKPAELSDETMEQLKDLGYVH